MAEKGEKSETIIVDARPSGERRSALFTVTSGSEVGRVISIPIGEVVSFGRDASCTYPFADASLSREHARVMYVNGGYILHDVGSTNGSYVNDTRIDKAVTLRDGDRVQFGSNTVLRFAVVSQAEEDALRKVYDASIRDGLTGVYNRKALEERMRLEVTAAERDNTPLSIVVIDVDFFKRVNDTYGHLGGDAVLRAVGWLLATGVRQNDTVGRYGGEEFVVVAPMLDGYGAVGLAERIRASIAARTVLYEGHPIAVTASCGVAAISCVGRADSVALLGLADSRLYQAKQQGRNRVVGPSPTPPASAPGSPWSRAS